MNDILFDICLTNQLITQIFALFHIHLASGKCLHIRDFFSTPQWKEQTYSVKLAI